MRQPLVAGNWKMHGTRASVEALLRCLLDAELPAGVDVAVCPTYVHLAQACGLCAAGKKSPASFMPTRPSQDIVFQTDKCASG